jgi:hypothetical protein
VIVRKKLCPKINCQRGCKAQILLEPLEPLLYVSRNFQATFTYLMLTCFKSKNNWFSMGCDAVYVCISVYQLVGSRIISWGRCYDFLDIFAEKIGKKLAFLAQNKGKLCKILIITLVFEKNAYFFA